MFLKFKIMKKENLVVKGIHWYSAHSLVKPVYYYNCSWSNIRQLCLRSGF